MAKRTILKDRAHEVAINAKYNGYQRELTGMKYKFLEMKTRLEAIATSKMGASVKEKLVQDLQKPVIKKFKRWKVYAKFKDNIWVADFPAMESLFFKY